MADELRQRAAKSVSGVERYNPENIESLEKYVTLSASENFYDLEVYLAVLEMYALRPQLYNQDIVTIIVLKAFTNLPHPDLTLCKSIQDLHKAVQYDEYFGHILFLSQLLETCQFEFFWEKLSVISHKTQIITGLEDSIRRYVCHVIAITYQSIEKSALKVFLGLHSDAEVGQWISSNNWEDQGDGYVFVANQEDNIKSKNITEKIDFNAIASILRSSAK